MFEAKSLFPAKWQLIGIADAKALAIIRVNVTALRIGVAKQSVCSPLRALVKLPMSCDQV